MLETETELYKLGVPVKTRHNEVSPAQYEIAVTFENANVATDHNMLVMETMKRVATAMASSSCCTRSRSRVSTDRASTSTGPWPMMAETTCSSPAKRLTRTRSSCSFYSPLSARSRGTVTCFAFRWPLLITIIGLGPTRLPRPLSRFSWAICSRTSSSRSKKGAPRRPRPVASSRSAFPSCRRLPRDPGDRNRTSPFAFTGNKFEFCAVGSSQSVAGPIVVLNTIVAESLDDFATHLEQAVAAGKNLNTEIQSLLQDAVKESKHVIFNGDNYNEAWHIEAERRGLPNRRNAVDSLPDLISAKNANSSRKYGIFNERELHSRFEIFVEGYRKTINIESQLTIHIAKRMILPAAFRYQAEIAGAISSLKATERRCPRFNWPSE